MLLDHLGHWEVLETRTVGKEPVDLSKYIGFVYVISFEDGTKYIGAKKIWKRIVKPPMTFKRGPRKGFEQSDWRTYTSSSNEVNNKIENGIHPSQYLIVGFYDSWGKTLFAEALLQLRLNIFANRDVWLNYQVDGTFTSSCYDETIYMNIDDYCEYHTSQNIPVFTNDIIMDINLGGEEVKGFEMAHIFPSNEFFKLLSGSIDEYSDIKLSDDIRRRDWAFKYDNKYYKTRTELTKTLDIKPKDLVELEGLEENTIEKRTEYVNRLLENKVEYKIERRYV